MKIAIVLALLSLAACAPNNGIKAGTRGRNDRDYNRGRREDIEATILTNEFQIGPEHGRFISVYKTSNNITDEREGFLLDDGGQFKVGWFSYPINGELVTIVYTAGRHGYVVDSPVLPKAPPMPQHALEQIARAEELKRQGVEWDERGFRI